MFEGSLVESTPLLRTQNRWPALVSVATQTVLVAILLAIPLLHPEALSFNTNKLTSLAPPALRPVPPPPPPQPVRVTAAVASTPSLAPPTQPAQIQRSSFITDAPTVAGPALAVGTTGMPGVNSLSSLLDSGPPSPHVTVAGPSTNMPTGKVPVSSGVIAGLLIEPIRPVYPPIARISRTEGVVIVQAIISKTGRIESAHAVSGPAVLQGAAVAAVEAARYRPYLLNGLPTEVETTITINFKLGS